MDQLQLYINDHLVDLSEDSPIALSFQINNLADVRNQQGNTSNQFKIPLTQRNRQILGFPDNVAFTSDLPYKKYDAKVVQDGLEIVPYGIAELNSVDQDNASMTILSGNVDFFDLIDGKIYDMGDKTSQWTDYGKKLVWQPYEHKWNLNNVVTSQTKTDGWIWPVVDYGLTEDTEDAAIMDIRHMRPGFFIKTAIDLLLKSTGYKGTGSLFADPLYPLLLCQFSNSNFEHGTDYQSNINYKSMSAELGQHFTVANPRGEVDRRGNIQFSIISDPDHTTIGRPDDSYYADELISVNASFTYSITFRSTQPSRGDYSTKLNIQLRVIDANTGLNHLITQHVYDYAARGESTEIIANKQTLSADDLILNPGQRLKVFYEFGDATGGSFTIVKGAKFTVTNRISDVQFENNIQCERIFPDISQKDLLKDTLQRFGIICQTDNTGKTISFNSFRDIVNNIPIAKNWTAKCVDQGKQITFQLGNYAQVNYLQYKADENVLPAKFGWSQINIKDQTLPAGSTLFESVFSPTLNRPFYGRTIAQIKMVDSTDGSTDFNIGVEPRILIDQKVDLRKLNNKTITFTDGKTNVVVNDIVSTPYFYKEDAPDLPNGYGKASLHFDDLRQKYYPELEEILTETKKVVRYILLTPRDILELDLLIPVYLEQDSTYYYINKIDSWRKGQPTKVELVKLG